MTEQVIFKATVENPVHKIDVTGIGLIQTYGMDDFSFCLKNITYIVTSLNTDGDTLYVDAYANDFRVATAFIRDIKNRQVILYKLTETSLVLKAEPFNNDSNS